ncbi:hypothetical protein LSUCC0031_04060 [Rhodobacterales bacterium LSUCC0031]|nr:hypothetical protein [Rhodobacterales bacterium LSUCC0031]
MPKARPAILLGCAAIIMAACQPTDTPPSTTKTLHYVGVETRLLDDDLVNFRVQIGGDATRDDVDAYARCAAAQYALIRGFGFARHVRTNMREQGGVWIADAVYTISPALPRGLQTLDAEVVAAACAEQGIPTV